MRKLFLHALADLMERTGTSRPSLATSAGVSLAQLNKALQRQAKGESPSMNVDDALKIADFFGLTVNELVGDAIDDDRLRLAQAYLQLTPRERAFLRALEAQPPDQGQA